MSTPSIEVQNISMCFQMYNQKVDNLKERVVRMLRREEITSTPFWALQDIDFTLYRGDSLGVIGVNGAGKSTLLKLIAGVLKPTSGSIQVYGRVVPLIELGAGFDVDLTARENIYLVGAMHGHAREFMRHQFQEIMDFAELHEFVDVPLKNYSSGMMARLGFAISTISQPDVLILDEVLAVGDFKFQEKCLERMQRMMSGDVTLLFVSHNAKQVAEMCAQTLWLEHGHIRRLGPSQDVCGEYLDS